MTRIFAPTRPAVKPSREGIFPDPDEHREPYTAADRDWAAVALNEHAVDFDVEDDPFEQLDPKEFHAWLDSIAPTEGELEARDRTDCGFGHPA